MKALDKHKNMEVCTQNYTVNYALPFSKAAQLGCGQAKGG
jgi:hypothetical protein